MKDALHKLDEAGHIAYVVGGSVRDFLLERQHKDHDVATSANPDELCELFPGAVTVGKAYGVIKVPVLNDVGEQVVLEIATFREDLEYRDHRHPTGVLFSGPEGDASRRDFTINALFYDPKTQRVLDTVGGYDDLKAKVVRAIGNPVERFEEDALRLLRAVRFATRLGFRLEESTAEAVKRKARLIRKVSAERIRDELTLMLTGPGTVDALRILSDLSLLEHVLPELEAMKGVEQPGIHHPEGDVWNHTLKIMGYVERFYPRRSAALAWGSLLHDVGKPVASRRSGGENFHSHEKDSEALARKICARLKITKADTETVGKLAAEHLKFKDVFQMREATLQRWLRQPYFEDLLALHRADAMASDGNLAYYEFCASRLEEFKRQPSVPRLVDGEDLIQLGLKPGPEFSRILEAVEDEVLEGRMTSKEDALEYVVKHFVK